MASICNWPTSHPTIGVSIFVKTSTDTKKETIVHLSMVFLGGPSQSSHLIPSSPSMRSLSHTVDYEERSASITLFNGTVIFCNCLMVGLDIKNTKTTRAVSGSCHC